MTTVFENDLRTLIVVTEFTCNLHQCCCLITRISFSFVIANKPSPRSIMKVKEFELGVVVTDIKRQLKITNSEFHVCYLLPSTATLFRSFSSSLFVLML
jgi:hypothetical protein